MPHQRLGWGQGTHSFRKVLTAMAAPLGATCSEVASTWCPCSIRKRHEEATATSSHVPANWGRPHEATNPGIPGPDSASCTPIPSLYLSRVKVGLGLDLADRGGGCKIWSPSPVA